MEVRKNLNIQYCLAELLSMERKIETNTVTSEIFSNKWAVISYQFFPAAMSQSGLFYKFQWDFDMQLGIMQVSGTKKIKLFPIVCCKTEAIYRQIHSRQPISNLNLFFKTVNLSRYWELQICSILQHFLIINDINGSVF